MKSSVPSHLWCGIVPSSLALLVLALPLTAQSGGTNAPSANGSSSTGGAPLRKPQPVQKPTKSNPIINNGSLHNTGGTIASGVNGSDDCATAPAISGSGNFAFDSTGATTGTAGSQDPSCNEDIWWEWTATGNGVASFSTCNDSGATAGEATFDTKIHVYNGAGCPADGQASDANNDDGGGCGGFSSHLGGFPVTGGSTYMIQLGGWSAGETGTGVLAIVESDSPANDECAGAEAISGDGSFAFDNSTCTTGAENQNEAICYDFGSSAIDNDCWFAWTATVNGDVVVDTCGGTSMDSKLAISSGSCGALTVLACNDDTCGVQSEVGTAVTNGSTYYIQVGNFSGSAGGTGSINVTQTAVPDPEILGEAGQFNVYSTRRLTINNASIAGRIGANKRMTTASSVIAHGNVPADVDSMASGRSVWASSGVLQSGNIVAGNNLNNLEDNFYLVNSSEEPRIDDEAWNHEAMSAELFMLSATYGAMMPTGVVTDNGFGTLSLEGSGSNPEIFLITDNQLEDASHVTVSADPGANILINVEGGRVSPSNFGFQLQGTTPNRVLLNMFEAWEIDFSQTSLSASILAPDSNTYIGNISVTGNIVGRHVELSSVQTQGDLLTGSIPSSSPFMFSQPMEENRDTLYHNLVVQPLTPGGHVTVSDDPLGGAVEVTVDGSTPHLFRSEKIGMLTFGGGVLSEHVTLDPKLDLPIHFLEDGPLGGNDLISLEREEADITRRGVIPLEVLKNDLAGTVGLDVKSIRIVTQPQRGVARVIPDTGQIWYGWPDAVTWTRDRFQYEVHDKEGVASQVVTVHIIQ